MRLHARILAPLALLLLSGCAATAGGPESTDGLDAAAAGRAVASDAVREDARRIGAADRGERVALAPGTLSGRGEIVVGEAYRAASGRRCRRLLDVDGAPLERIACGSGERWRIVRSLDAPGSAPRLPLIVPAAPVRD